MKEARAAIAVVGAAVAEPRQCDLARALGGEIARAGAVLVCGGRGGVMEAAAQGARLAGGHTIGILPGYERSAANDWIEFVIATGMGEARNAVVVASAQAVVALVGEAGTLSEVALALKLGRPVVGLDAWAQVPGVIRAQTPAQAVALALAAAGLA